MTTPATPTRPAATLLPSATAGLALAWSLTASGQSLSSLRFPPPEGGVAAVGAECGDTALIQHNSDTATLGIGCFDSRAAASKETSWARAFAIPAGNALLVNCVEFSGFNLSANPFTVEVRLKLGSTSDPYDTLTTVATLAVTLPSATAGTIFVADFQANGGSVWVPPGSTLIVEVYSATRLPSEGGPGGITLVGSDQHGQSAPCYLRSVPCNTPELTPLSALGFPNAALIISAGGDTAGCTADLNADGGVDGSDLGVLLSQWGLSGGVLAGDVNADGEVNGADLGTMLGTWGPC